MVEALGFGCLGFGKKGSEFYSKRSRLNDIAEGCV